MLRAVTGHCCPRRHLSWISGGLERSACCCGKDRKAHRQREAAAERHAAQHRMPYRQRRRGAVLGQLVLCNAGQGTLAGGVVLRQRQGGGPRVCMIHDAAVWTACVGAPKRSSSLSGGPDAVMDPLQACSRPESRSKYH